MYTVHTASERRRKANRKYDREDFNFDLTGSEDLKSVWMVNLNLTLAMLSCGEGELLGLVGSRRYSLG